MIIPRPTYTEVSSAPQSMTEGQTEAIRRYLDVPNWVHSKCGATMFGRMTYCVYCWSKTGEKISRD